MTLAEALPLAEAVRIALAPCCLRCEIAGSTRRRCPEVGDVEIVCVPSPRHLFRFADMVNRWPRIKGAATGRYTQRRLPSGMQLDLFLATPENWGLIFAIRTGSARFAHEVLARGWVKAGYVSREGVLRPRAKSFGLAEDGEPVPIHEERDLFDLIGVPWVAPEERI